MPETVLTRMHRSRLMQVWRSAGWPCKDGIEVDLLAARLIEARTSADGRETLVLTEAGLRVLAESRRRSARALSAHDRLAQRFAAQLLAGGRIVWRELSLRAVIDAPPAAGGTKPSPDAAPLWDTTPPADAPAATAWRMARPDLFSVRNTSVEAYLLPMVHEVKATRADLLSDLRHEAKRQAYRWLCSACYYVFPADIAQPEEIPEAFGIWVLHGDPEDGRFELLRPARHAPCTLPFAVWLALAKATPMRPDEDEAAQGLLGDERQHPP